MSFSSNELLNGIRTDNRESRDRATKIDDMKDHIGHHFEKNSSDGCNRLPGFGFGIFSPPKSIFELFLCHIGF